MKVLVTYLSRTGNTKKVAEAIFEEIQTAKDIKALNQTNGFDGYDMIFVGFPIELYGPPKEVSVFLEQHSAGENVALFITHAAKEDAKELPEWLAKCKTAVAHANLVGTFNCQGELGEQIANYMLKSPDQKLVSWAKERSSTSGATGFNRTEKSAGMGKEHPAESPSD